MNTRKGTRVATIAALAAIIGACSSGGNNNQGTISVSLMDRPVDGITELNITVTEFWIKPQGAGPAFELDMVETPVTATVISHGKAGKIKVVKMKRRKNYRRTQGHRQLFTEIEITGIGGAKAPAKMSVKEKPVEAKTAVVESDVAADNAAKSDSVGDNLTRINGIGPVIEKKLLALGITTFKQIAEFDQVRIDEVNEQLSFKGRVEREEWVQQAKELAG